MNGEVEFKAKQIKEAFDRFSNYDSSVPFRVGIRGDNWLSIILNDHANFDHEWSFQRVTSDMIDDMDDPSAGFNKNDTANQVSFFGRYTPSEDDLQLYAVGNQYGPIDFEIFGDRKGIMVDFIWRDQNNLYVFDNVTNIVDKFQSPTLYQSQDKWYKKLLEFGVNGNDYIYIKDPMHLEDKVMVMTSSPINLLYGSIFNAYSIHPLNISLMGFNPVKDIDYTVYDQSIGYESVYKYNREDDASTYYLSLSQGQSTILDIQGSFIVTEGSGNITVNGTTSPFTSNFKFNTFDSSVFIEVQGPTHITYAVLDGSFNYKGYKDGSSGNEENVSDYYESNTYLKYGLTVPLIAKWVGIGNDCRNNPMRMILNNGVLDVSTNFIPTSDSFTQEISYPSFKYLSPGERAWEDYVFYDINDVMVDGSAY